MPGVRDLTGQRFGKLRVIERAGSNKFGKVTWRCICDCNKETIAIGNSLVNGHTKSCGCIKEPLHGLCAKYLAEYNVWHAMLNRCYREGNDSYAYYGGRGIGVCESWRESFENFINDMGPRPEGMSIDRKDSNKDYGPDNCRWADWDTQCNNRRSNHFIEYNGVSLTNAQWSKVLNINYDCINTRLNRHSSPEQALSKNGYPPVLVMRNGKLPNM